MIQGARAESVQAAVEAGEPAPLDRLEEPGPLAEAEPASRRQWPALLAVGLLAIAAIGWLAILSATLAAAAPLTPLRLLAWIGLGCGPLALLGVLALPLLRGERLRTEEHRVAAATLRAETAALASTMAGLMRQLAAARAELAGGAATLAELGADASGRMTRAAAELGTQADAVRRTAATLDESTATARADLGVLLSDLPRAEAATQALAERLRQSGAEADMRGRALVDLLAALDERARAASESTGGAAARLAAQLDRVDGGATAAEQRIGETAAAMARIVDQALEAAAGGVEETRRVVAGQAAALTALVDQSKASLDAVGADAARSLDARLDGVQARLEALGTGLGEQDHAARAWLGDLEQAVGAIEARLSGFVRAGIARTGDLGVAIETVQGRAEAVNGLLAAQERAATVVLDRVSQLRLQAEAGGTTLGETIPAAFARVRLHAEQSLQAIGAAEERGERLHDTAQAFGARLAEADALLQRQKQLLDETGDAGGQQLAALSEQASALRMLIVRTDAEVRELTEGASGELVEALLRVREAATEAGDTARDALTAAIPRAAQRLGESAARALSLAVSEVGRAELDAVGEAARQAVETARAASERLSQQLVTIAETAVAIDARIDANRTETEAYDEGNFARSAGLLIEALNSTSIDLTRLFASEVSEEAWKSYLRGDRGVFTRRAVKLLDRAEAGAIAERYQGEPEFQTQVNRFIHDFEALIRRVMATHDGTGLATTLLSADMGKLYVALGQAIERFRR